MESPEVSGRLALILGGKMRHFLMLWVASTAGFLSAQFAMNLVWDFTYGIRAEKTILIGDWSFPLASIVIAIPFMAAAGFLHGVVMWGLMEHSTCSVSFRPILRISERAVLRFMVLAGPFLIWILISSLMNHELETAWYVTLFGFAMPGIAAMATAWIYFQYLRGTAKRIEGVDSPAR